MYDYWQKQSSAKPLFPNLLWSRPENKLASGRLLIIGGSISGINEVSQSYTEATKAGIGLAQIVLPDKLRAIVGNSFEQTFFAGSNKSGGFASSALSVFDELGETADGILVAGQLGNNSETNILFDKYLSAVKQPIVVSGDAIDHIVLANPTLLELPNLVLVCEITQLQKLATKAHSPQPVTSNMPLNQLVQFAHDFTKSHKISVLTRQSNYFLVASTGQVVTTDITKDRANWPSLLSAHSIVFIIQNQANKLAALSCAALNIQEN